MDTLTITRPQLQAALLRWEQSARDGSICTRDDTAPLPPDQVAADNAAYLWAELQRPAADASSHQAVDVPALPA